MRILEIGERRHVSQYAPTVCDFYTVFKDGGEEQRLTRRHVLTLIKRLKAGYYDLVIYHITAKMRAPWDRNRTWARVFFDVFYGTFFQFHKIGWNYFHWFFRGTSIPLIVIDTQDAPRISKSESYWLDRCRFWFMRELAPNYMNLFLNMDKRCGDATNIGRQPILRRSFSKIEPFSLGFHLSDFKNIEKIDPSKKIHDIFYVGANHTTTVRQHGIEEMRALRAAGYRVYLPEQRLSKSDFLQACAQSWLVWSPEGQGWDCFRHYEALMCHSVPLINLPTIERLWPFRHGEHCLYYGPEKGGLTQAVKEALQDREALVKIAERGREYIIQHHTRSQLARHVLEKIGVFDQVEPYFIKA